MKRLVLKFKSLLALEARQMFFQDSGASSMRLHLLLPVPDVPRLATFLLPLCGQIETLVRQAKLGVSCWVKVPVEQGLTNHSYRVLQP